MFFFFVSDDLDRAARLFVHGDTFQLSLMFEEIVKSIFSQLNQLEGLTQGCYSS
jgi:hypothetical protein